MDAAVVRLANRAVHIGRDRDVDCCHPCRRVRERFLRKFEGPVVFHRWLRHISARAASAMVTVRHCTSKIARRRHCACWDSLNAVFTNNKVQQDVRTMRLRMKTRVLSGLKGGAWDSTALRGSVSILANPGVNGLSGLLRGEPP